VGPAGGEAGAFAIALNGRTVIDVASPAGPTGWAISPGPSNTMRGAMPRSTSGTRNSKRWSRSCSTDSPTNDILVAARRLYETAGFTLVREAPHHSFGHDLVGRFRMLELR